MRTFLSVATAAAAMLSAAPAGAQTQAGDWLVRLRGIMVSPTEDSGPVSGIAGSEVGVGDSVMPEIDFTYLVTDHIGAELILATTKHGITGRGSIGALDQIADTWVLPPTLTLQYHFAPRSHVRPYVGAGVNYTIFYSADASRSLEGALGGETSVKLDESFGYALQAGVDVDVTRKFFVNADIKYIDMNTTAHLATGATRRSVDVDINPIVAGVGIGFRF
ncbi:OmpW/AlkL family protein [Sphingomonas psychrotolerans]|uniref:OmpW family protein n=1 Tax=Sphingomonas psychrotolerans TaxID=1327635 RepID=A0A2K8MKL9_9SPHN|nr:OmpW family outer membrane protein [Sphingomonas psychrotolerans]ATY33554.1 hypothetical protein CVN68_17605 [Sphingomonas psychrotolerans]